MTKLDLRDIKLLYILSNNSREPISKISKEISLSNDSIKNRIIKLEKLGILKSYKLNINFSKLGFKEFDVYLKLKNFSQKELTQIISFIKLSKYSTWIGTTFGKYDLRVSLIVKESGQIYDFLESFRTNFENQLVEYLILEILDKYKISQKKIYSNLFDVDEKVLNFSSKNVVSKKSSDFKFDDVDKNIIRILNMYPKNTLLESSRKLNITPEGLKYRINSLFSLGIISKHSIILDGNKLNKIWAVILFKFNSGNSDKFTKFLQDQKNISAFVKCLGSWNYSVTVFASDVSEIHKILMSFRNKFPEIISDYEMNLVFDTYKYPSVPDVVYGVE